MYCIGHVTNIMHAGEVIAVENLLTSEHVSSFSCSQDTARMHILAAYVNSIGISSKKLLRLFILVSQLLFKLCCIR